MRRTVCKKLQSYIWNTAGSQDVWILSLRIQKIRNKGKEEEKGRKKKEKRRKKEKRKKGKEGENPKIK